MSTGFTALFRVDILSGFVSAAIGVFFVLTCLYSLKFMRGKPHLLTYYLCLILTALAAIGAVLANNLVLLLALWGFLGITLYILIGMGQGDARSVAKKTLVIVGGSDALMILGIAIIYSLTGTFDMDKIRIPHCPGSWGPMLAYVCLAVGCFAKAGAMPFHSWIPDCATSAPIPVVAYLPASLDKLLGIYLLARISLDMFVLTGGMQLMLMVVGAFTVLAAVSMALVQHNVKRLLGYHAVSQVGYMVLGIGTGNPIGIAGALFHMLNHAVYKSCLFFSAGNVEYRAQTSELEDLGGLAKVMPVTYLTFMVAAFSISGIPPFNGFVSKWLIYQGIISRVVGSPTKPQMLLTAACLIAALFGSALTLASFMKLLHAIFLGQRLSSLESRSIKEVPPAMWVPVVVLALICIIFGIFAFGLPLKYLILPYVYQLAGAETAALNGKWLPIAATLLVLCGLFIGYLVFAMSGSRGKVRRDAAYIGGENEVPHDQMPTGVDFYRTIEEMGFMRKMYALAAGKYFDIYEQGKNFLSLSRFLQYLHNGVLPSYLVWILLGMAGLLIVLMR